MISKLIMVGIGGGYGALIRLLITNHCKKNYKGAYLPYWTWTINILGTWIMAIFIKVNMDNTLLIFLGSGGLGGFTTFSTFNYEIANIFLRHEFRKSFLYFFSIYGIAIGGAIIILKI